MKKWEAKQIIVQRYGCMIKGRHVDDMSEAQLITIARAILERMNDEVFNISAYIEKGFVIAHSSNNRSYYYNSNGDLCITNDAGEEEPVDSDSLNDEEKEVK